MHGERRGWIQIALIAELLEIQPRQNLRESLRRIAHELRRADTARRRARPPRILRPAMTPEDLAREVLKAKDRYALLSLGSDTPIKPDAEGFLNLEDEDVRRVYLKMAARIHPDKIPGFADGRRSRRPIPPHAPPRTTSAPTTRTTRATRRRTTTRTTTRTRRRRRR